MYVHIRQDHHQLNVRTKVRERLFTHTDEKQFWSRRTTGSFSTSSEGMGTRTGSSTLWLEVWCKRSADVAIQLLVCDFSSCPNTLMAFLSCNTANTTSSKQPRYCLLLRASTNKAAMSSMGFAKTPQPQAPRTKCRWPFSTQVRSMAWTLRLVNSLYLGDNDPSLLHGGLA